MFASLWTNIREVFFPVKLPPLVLESKPIPVVDRMKTKQDPRATAASVVIYALMMLLILWAVSKHVQFASPVNKAMVIGADATSADAGREGQDGWWRWTAGPDAGDQGHRCRSLRTSRLRRRRLLRWSSRRSRCRSRRSRCQKDLKMANNNYAEHRHAELAAAGELDGQREWVGAGIGQWLGTGAGVRWQLWRRRAADWRRRLAAGADLSRLSRSFREEARKAKFMGVVMVNIVVDEQWAAEECACDARRGNGTG